MDVRARRQPAGIVFAVSLTLVAGYVDAIGFLGFGGIYVANMSGNSVAVGIRVARGEWVAVLQRLLPIAIYVIGLLAARTLVNFSRSFTRITAVLLAIESGLLVTFMISAPRAWAILIAALAMGVQSAAVTRFDGVSIFTAFVTGSLVKFSEAASEFLRGCFVRDDTLRRDAFRDAIWFLGVWIAYVAGACFGTGALALGGIHSILWASAALVLLSVYDAFSPVQISARV